MQTQPSTTPPESTSSTPASHSAAQPFDLAGILGPADVRLYPEISRDWSKVDAKFSKCVMWLMKNHRWPLFLHGSTGTGKTCGALALCDHISRSAGAAYFTLEELCRLTLGADQEAKANAWEAMETKALVVVDEIGERRANKELVYSVMRDVLERRERFRKGVAIYISNLEPDAIRDVFDDRVFSRMMRGTKCKLDGIDQRGLFE